MTLTWDASSWLPVLTLTNAAARLMGLIPSDGLPFQRAHYPGSYDPLVLAHARALLTSAPEGATSYIDADIREPDVILDRAAETLDFDRPVALLLLGILGHITDEEDPEGILARLVAPLVPGSHVVINDGTNVTGADDADAPDETARARAIARYVEAGGVPYHLRSPERIAGYFAGMELLEPGVVSVSRWRPEPSAIGEPPEVDAFCGVARIR